MGKLFWTRHLEWQNAVDVVNDLDWNLRWKELDGHWYLWAGESRLFVADTEEELQAFVLGMAVSITALPDPVIEEVKRIIAE